MIIARVSVIPLLLLAFACFATAYLMTERMFGMPWEAFMVIWVVAWCGVRCAVAVLRLIGGIGRAWFASAVLVLLVAAQPASADAPVIDVSNLVAQAKNLQQFVASYTTQLKQYATELQSLEQQVQAVTWAATEAQSLIQHPSLGAVQGLMSATGLNNDLPVNIGSVEGIVSGFGGPTSFSSLAGRLSMLSSLSGSAFNQNHLYTCGDNSFACTQSTQNATSIAGVQGIAQTLLNDVQSHMAVLTGLRADAATATDPAQRENIQVALNTEAGWLQNQQAQLQAVGLLQAAQVRSQQQIATEAYHQDLANEITALRAALPTGAPQ